MFVDKQLHFANLSYKTTEQNLINYFSKYGSIEKLILHRDDQEQSLRKGLLICKDPMMINELMYKRPHVLDQREIFLQRAMPIVHQSSFNHYLSESMGINLTVKEIFISRLCCGETREMFMNYFQRFGMIEDCRVFNSYSRNAKQMGYAFVRFEDYDSVGKTNLFFNRFVLLSTYAFRSNYSHSTTYDQFEILSYSKIHPTRI